MKNKLKELEVLKGTMLPFMLIIDLKGQILASGNGINKLAEKKIETLNFNEIFSLTTPATFDKLLSDKSNPLIKFILIGSDTLFKANYHFYENEQALFLNCTPIFNSSHSLGSTNLTLVDFPESSVIAEYLFLMESNKRGLADAFRLINNIKEKNKNLKNAFNEIEKRENQLEIAKNTLLKLNGNLENIVEQKTKKLRSNELQLEISLRKEKERTIALKNSEKKLKKSLVKEKELGQLKASFVTVASHQFRTPLAVIQSNTELFEMLLYKMIEKKELEKFTIITNRIKVTISKMTNLMEDVLTHGKLTSGKVVCNPEELDLIGFCDKLAEEFNSVQIDGRKIDVVAEGEDYTLHLDPKLLEHTLSNLISNAFKYSIGKANPELNIDYRPKKVVLSIKDYGLGIPEEEQLHLFEPFFRADNVTEIQGTGLGLSIAKEYVEVNKGKISAKSILGEGSCFEITFNKN